MQTDPAQPGQPGQPGFTGAPNAPPISGLTTTWAHLRQRAARTAVFVVAMCVCIALLLTALDGGGFFQKLAYSLCVGACCTLLTDLLRLALAAALDMRARQRGVPVSSGPYGTGWTGAVLASAPAAVFGPMLGMTLADRLTGLRSPSLSSLGAANTRVTFALTLLGTLAAVVVLGSMERLATARAQAEAAQRLAAENQLRLLQSQLEPHMLFNTLANLRVLIGLDAARAQAMLPADRLPARHAQRVSAAAPRAAGRVRAPRRLPGADGRAHGTAAAHGTRPTF